MTLGPRLGKRSHAMLFCIATLSGPFSGELLAAEADESADGDETEAEARELFRAGREAMRADRIDEACELFRQSLSLRPAIGTRLNLALCSEQRGDAEAARTLLQELRRDVPADDPRHALVVERLTALEAAARPAVPQASSDQAGASAHGAPPPTRGSEVATSLPPPSPATPTALDDVQGPGPGALWAFGVAGAAWLTSLASAALILRQSGIVDRECTPRCTDAGMEAGSRGRLYSAVGTTSFLVGVAGVGLGAFLWGSEDVRVDVAAGSESTGLSVRGRF